MIDERLQELASLYAFDLLDGAERSDFEAALSQNAELRALVAELRHTAAALAHTAPSATPPPELKQRLLATLDAGASPADDEKVVPFSATSTVFRVLPWAIAAGFAISTAWLSERYFVSRTESQLLRDREALAEIALRTTQAQLESEHLVSQRVAADFNALQTRSDALLAEAQGKVRATEQQLAELKSTSTTLEQQLADARKRETEVRAEVVALQDQAKRDADLARLKIATLASMLNNSPQAVAVAVWDPKQQQGVFTADQLPANAKDQSYELWVIDSKPVSAGVFTVGPDGRAKVSFRPSEQIRTAVKFAVSREKRDGAASHATPGEVIMISQ